MAALTRLVSPYLPAWIAGQRHAETGDGALVRRFVEARDGDAFAELVRRHGPMVVGLARRVAGDGQLAEDVAQATFLVLARKGHTVRRPESLAAWLHGVAFRLALRARKAGARRSACEARAVAAPPPREPLDELSARELLAVLDEELQRLADRHRLPLVLCGLEGLSQEEAARRLGCSSGAVRGRLERGRLLLRRRLARRGLTLPAAMAGTLLAGSATAAVPPAWVESVCRTARTGQGASPAALALADHAVRAVLVAKLRGVAAIVVAVSLVGLGLGWWHDEPAPPDGAQPVAVVAPDEPGRDLHGDELPEGAVQRLGTVQRRAVGAQLALSRDGKLLIGVRGCLYVHVWDAATGLLKERHQLARPEPNGPIDAPQALSPHGRRLATGDYFMRSLHVWDVLNGKQLREFVILDGTGNSGGPGRSPIGINAVAFTPDEDVVATIFRVGQKSFLRAWDLKTGAEVLDRAFPDVGGIEFLAFTPDAKRLIVADNAGLSAHDFPGGKRLWSTRVSPVPAWYAFTPDDRVLVQGDGVRAWDLATGNPAPSDRMPPREWDGPITLTPDGKTLLVGGPGGVLVWDLAQGRALRTLTGAGEEMVLAPDAKTVVTNRGVLQRWDIATGKPLYPDTFAQGHAGEVVAVVFSADGKRLASGSTDGSVRLWDVPAGRPLQVWPGHTVVRSRPSERRLGPPGVAALDLTADGRRVVSAGSDGPLRVWEVGSDRPVRTLALPGPVGGETDRQVQALHLRAGGRRVCALVGNPGLPPGVVNVPSVLDTRSRLVTWDAQTGASLDPAPLGGLAPVFSADGDFLLAGGAVHDVVTGRLLARLERSETEWPEPPYAFSRDGLLVASALAHRGKANGQEFLGPAGGAVWEARTGKRVARFPIQSWFGGVALHPDGRHVAVNDLDGIQLVDLASGKVAAKYAMPERIRAGTTAGTYASCLAFPPDGRRMATGHPDGTILLWDVALPKRSPAPLEPGEADALWADLAHADTARAWRAVWRLADFPDAALPVLRQHLRPVAPAPDAVVRPLLADLDGDDFDRREAATAALRTLGIQAEPALRAHREGKVSLETKRRVDGLLKEIVAWPVPESLAPLRGVAVLARLDAAAARPMLDELARGIAHAPLTRAARAALGR